MDSKRILYPAQNGSVNVVIPAEGFDIGYVAKKDVPMGVPYLIRDVDFLPKTIEERQVWVVDFSTPDGFGEGVE